MSLPRSPRRSNKEVIASISHQLATESELKIIDLSHRNFSSEESQELISLLTPHNPKTTTTPVIERLDLTNSQFENIADLILLITAVKSRYQKRENETSLKPPTTLIQLKSCISPMQLYTARHLYTRLAFSFYELQKLYSDELEFDETTQKILEQLTIEITMANLLKNFDDGVFIFLHSLKKFFRVIAYLKNSTGNEEHKNKIGTQLSKITTVNIELITSHIVMNDPKDKIAIINMLIFIIQNNPSIRKYYLGKNTFSLDNIKSLLTVLTHSPVKNLIELIDLSELDFRNINNVLTTIECLERCGMMQNPLFKVNLSGTIFKEELFNGEKLSPAGVKLFLFKKKYGAQIQLDTKINYLLDIHEITTLDELEKLFNETAYFVNPFNDSRLKNTTILTEYSHLQIDGLIGEPHEIDQPETRLARIIAYIIQFNPCIRAFTISNCKFSQSDIEIFTRALASNTKITISFENCSFGDTQLSLVSNIQTSTEYVINTLQKIISPLSVTLPSTHSGFGFFSPSCQSTDTEGSTPQSLSQSPKSPLSSSSNSPQYQAFFRTPSTTTEKDKNSAMNYILASFTQ